MSDEYRPGGWGCFETLAAGVLIAVFLAVVAGAGGDSSSTSSTTRSGVLSGNQAELMSRNQLNIASEVQNCYGDYSCMTVISTTTSTESTTSTSLDVSGERNVITSQWGQALCWDEALQSYSSSACEGVQP